MNAAEAATKILDTMLGHLGFAAQIEVDEQDVAPCLQIMTSQSKFLIGRDGHRLDDLQYLVNRILRRHDPDAPRVKVDCEHYRTIHEDKLIEEVRGVAERVRASGEPAKLRPLNAYYRRLVHNALVDEPGIETHSPDSRERLKRIEVRVKGGGETKE